MRQSIPRDKVLELWKAGNTVGQIATLLGHHPSGVGKVLRTLPDYRPGRDVHRVWDPADDERLTHMYQVQGLGIRRCARRLELPEHVVAYALQRLGVVESDRRPKKLHKNGIIRTLMRKPFEFTKVVRSACYTREHGICQFCGKSVLPTLATYHHILPIDSGGDGSLPNCMLLHRKCHIDQFEALHGGRKWKNLLKNYSQSITRCCLCGRNSSKGAVCGRCLSKRKCPKCGGAISYRRSRNDLPCVGCLPNKDLRTFTDEQLLEAIQAGESPSALARRYGCSHQAVFKRIKKFKASGALR